MVRFISISLTAPSNWASYLINGDASGLPVDERAACDAWLVRRSLSFPVSCDDAGFVHTHDAYMFAPFGADCQSYTFLIGG